ncbi:MAG: type II toxin-antitoxin system HicA family toxin [Elusimicrobiota bacterium]
MRQEKLYAAIKNNPKNVRFADLCRLAEAFGFIRRGGKGSHCVYVRRGVAEIMNFQNVSGRVKPYQVRQFLGVIEKYQLGLEKGGD